MDYLDYSSLAKISPMLLMSRPSEAPVHRLTALPLPGGTTLCSFNSGGYG